MTCLFSERHHARIRTWYKSLITYMVMTGPSSECSIRRTEGQRRYIVRFCLATAKVNWVSSSFRCCNAEPSSNDHSLLPVIPFDEDSNLAGPERSVLFL